MKVLICLSSCLALFEPRHMKPEFLHKRKKAHELRGYLSAPLFSLHG